MDDNDFYLYDGSGMSMDDRIAPRAYTHCWPMRRGSPGERSGAKPCRWAASTAPSLGGSKIRRLKGRLWAKTGTHDEANSLSGYLTAANGKTLVFSILVNGHRPGSEAEVQAIDRIVEAIAAAE